RQQSVSVKVLNVLFADLHGGAEPRIEIAIQKKLVGGDAANVRRAQTGKLATCLEVVPGRKALHQALDGAIDIGIGRQRSTGDVRFVAHDPLIDQAVQNFGIALGLAFDEQLITRKKTNVTQKNDVALDARHDAVEQLLTGKLKTAEQSHNP